jgi:hypothetical protein
MGVYSAVQSSCTGNKASATTLVLGSSLEGVCETESERTRGSRNACSRIFICFDTRPRPSESSKQIKVQQNRVYKVAPPLGGVGMESPTTTPGADDSSITPSAPTSVSPILKVLCKWGGNLVWQHDGEGSPRYQGGRTKLLALPSDAPLSLEQLQHRLQALMTDGDKAQRAPSGTELAAAAHVVCKYQLHDAGPDELVSTASHTRLGQLGFYRLED